MNFNKWVCENYDTDSNGDIKLLSFVFQSILRIVSLSCIVVICAAVVVALLHMFLTSITNVGYLINGERGITSVVTGFFATFAVMVVVYFISSIKIAHCKTTKKKEDEVPIAFIVCIILFVFVMISYAHHLWMYDPDTMVLNGALTLLFAMSLGLNIEDVVNEGKEEEVSDEIESTPE